MMLAGCCGSYKCSPGWCAGCGEVGSTLRVGAVEGVTGCGRFAAGATTRQPVGPGRRLGRSGRAPDVRHGSPVMSYFRLTIGLRTLEKTKLSSKGQVIIPKPIRTAHQWRPGQELLVIDAGDGVLLRPKVPFKPTSIQDVAACLAYKQKAKSIDDMERAIQQGVKERFGDRP